MKNSISNILYILFALGIIIVLGFLEYQSDKESRETQKKVDAYIKQCNDKGGIITQIGTLLDSRIVCNPR